DVGPLHERLEAVTERTTELVLAGDEPPLDRLKHRARRRARDDDAAGVRLAVGIGLRAGDDPRASRGRLLQLGDGVPDRRHSPRWRPRRATACETASSAA